MTEDSEDVLNGTKTSVKRILDIDTKELPRKAALGNLSFEAAVVPTQRVVELFRKIPLEALNELTEKHLTKIRQAADQFYTRIDEIYSFDPSVISSPGPARDAVVQGLIDQYAPTFDVLFPYISFCVARTVDFDRLEREGRAAVQSVKDQTSSAMSELENARTESERIIAEVRKSAADQGVAQNAIFFKDEADAHKTQSENWRNYTIATAVGVAILAILLMFSHNIPGLNPTNVSSSLQIAIAKFLLVGSALYMLIFCARNFLSHNHNTVVNRHRHNALLTFRALVDAAESPERQGIVLDRAAESIFSAQDSGFSRSGAQGQGSSSPSTVLQQLLNSGQSAS